MKYAEVLSCHCSAATLGRWHDCVVRVCWSFCLLSSIFRSSLPRNCITRACGCLPIGSPDGWAARSSFASPLPALGHIVGRGCSLHTSAPARRPLLHSQLSLGSKRPFSPLDTSNPGMVEASCSCLTLGTSTSLVDSHNTALCSIKSPHPTIQEELCFPAGL